MNWIERLYEIKGRDLYSQNGESLILEYIMYSLEIPFTQSLMLDIGGSDGFYLSNSRHLRQLGMDVLVRDLETGWNVTKEQCHGLGFSKKDNLQIISIDIDGNDYWILNELLSEDFRRTFGRTSIICAEFNPAFGDSRTIKYNSNHVWDGTDYYGFSFHAGVKLAEANGYKVIFQIADMNMIMVREDLIKVPIQPVTFKLNNFFKSSERPESDWVFV